MLVCSSSNRTHFDPTSSEKKKLIQSITFTITVQKIAYYCSYYKIQNSCEFLNPWRFPQIWSI